MLTKHALELFKLVKPALVLVGRGDYDFHTMGESDGVLSNR